MADKLKKALEALEKKIEKVEHDFRMYGHTAANPTKHAAAHQKKLAKLEKAREALLGELYDARRKEQELYWENKQAAEAAKKEKAAATRNANQAKKDEDAAARKAARESMTEEEKEAKKKEKAERDAEEKSRPRRTTRSMKGSGRRTRRR